MDPDAETGTSRSALCNSTTIDRPHERASGGQVGRFGGGADTGRNEWDSSVTVEGYHVKTGDG